MVHRDSMVEYTFDGVVLADIRAFCTAFETQFGIKLMKATADETGVGGYIVQTPKELIIHFYTEEELVKIQEVEGPRPDLIAPPTVPTEEEIRAFITGLIG